MNNKRLLELAGTPKSEQEQQISEENQGLHEQQTTQPTFQIQGTYTSSAGKQKTTSAKVKAQSEKEAAKKVTQQLSEKYKDFNVSQVEKLSESADEQKGTFTIVHGTSDPTHREERIYTIVENVTKDQARKLAQDNLPKHEQDRYIIETTEGKYVPNGERPNYINPEQQQKQQQKQQQQLTEATERNAQKGGDDEHNWGHASLYEDMGKERMLQFAGLNEAEATGTKITFKRNADASDGSVTPIYVSDDGREHYPLKVEAGVPQSVRDSVLNALPKTFTWKKS